LHVSERPSARPRRARDGDLTSVRARRSIRTPANLRAAQANVGSFLRATRKARRWTQAEVAARARETTPWQLSRAAVSAIERGKNFPGLEAMLALSSVLQIDPKELIERARLSPVPVDVSGLSQQELERQASSSFWAGDFHKALAIYDAIVEMMTLEETADAQAMAVRLARVEIRRATALKRVGALLSAIASAERALSLSRGQPEIQAEAYVVLADLQAQRGHLPLAEDAARRAVELSAGCGPSLRVWAWMVQGRARYLAADYEKAREAFLLARDCALECEDETHLSHIEGNIGSCWVACGELARGQAALERAVAEARARSQPHLEASWTVELGKVALQEGRRDDACKLARAALRIARPLNHALTIFRAEWLLHRWKLHVRPGAPDRLRLSRLRELFLELDQHEGIDEIREYKAAITGGTEHGGYLE
jgi:transcriptional regulator with XRE-family HTH domain